MGNKAYTSSEIRDPLLCKVINLVCDAGEVLDGSRDFDIREVESIEQGLAGSEFSLAQVYHQRLLYLEAERLFQGQDQFELGRVQRLTRELKTYETIKARDYVKELQEIVDLVTDARDHVDGLREFQPQRVRWLIEELTPYAAQSRTISGIRQTLQDNL